MTPRIRRRDCFGNLYVIKTAAPVPRRVYSPFIFLHLFSNNDNEVADVNVDRFSERKRLSSCEKLRDHT